MPESLAQKLFISACAAASTLLAFNAANAAAGRAGGFFDLPAEAALEPTLAKERIDGRGEFIFDALGNFVNPDGAWLDPLAPECEAAERDAQDGLHPIAMFMRNWAVPGAT